MVFPYKENRLKNTRDCKDNKHSCIEYKDELETSFY